MLGCICKVPDKHLKQVSEQAVSQVVTLDVEDKVEIKNCFVQCLARTEKCRQTRQVAHEKEGSQRVAEGKIM